jgi:dihydroxy-acid dehydratase
LSVLLSDGRYSGVTYGAAIGHITPEAAQGGAIVGLCDGDLLLLSLRNLRIDWLDSEAFIAGAIRVHDKPSLDRLLAERQELVDHRLRLLERRATAIAPTNALVNVTDAARGVVPLELLRLERLLTSTPAGMAPQPRCSAGDPALSRWGPQ